MQNVKHIWGFIQVFRTSTQVINALDTGLEVQCSPLTTSPPSRFPQNELYLRPSLIHPVIMARSGRPASFRSSLRWGIDAPGTRELCARGLRCLAHAGEEALLSAPSFYAQSPPSTERLVHAPFRAQEGKGRPCRLAQDSPLHDRH